MKSFKKHGPCTQLQLPDGQNQLNQLSQVLGHYVGREVTRRNHLLLAFKSFQSTGCDLMGLEGIAVPDFVGSSWEQVLVRLVLVLAASCWGPTLGFQGALPPLASPQLGVDLQQNLQKLNFPRISTGIKLSWGSAPSVTLPCSPRQPGQAGLPNS